MKTLKILLVCAVALIAFAGCSDDVEEPFNLNQEDNQNQENNQESEHDEAYYAENASISCSDPNFTVTDDGAVVSFKVSGGEITIDVDCGTEWTAKNSAEELFDCTIKSTSITITAEQNLVKAELTGIITLITMPSQIEFATIIVTQDAYGSLEIDVETHEWNAPAVGELTTEIAVGANYEWTFNNDSNWLTVGKTETGIILTANENLEVTERICDVVLTCTDGIKSVSETVTVTQDGLAYITLSDEELMLSNSESSISVTVESNFEWTYNCDADWLTITKRSSSSMRINYNANDTGNNRETIANITAGDGAENIATAELKITQSCDNLDVLILEYTITSNNVTVRLPVGCVNYGSYDTVTIDWDDGNTETKRLSYGYYSYYASHRYTTPGIYAVSVDGNFSGLSSSCIPEGEGREYLTAVRQWGKADPTDVSEAFYSCPNLVSLPDGVCPYSNVKTFERTFYNCKSLSTIPENMFSVCSAVTSFASCFYGCSSLVSVPENMFSGCTSARDFTSCFYGCSSLVGVPENMFSGCSRATKFESCFQSCGLSNAPSFSGCSAVTSFYSCFDNCSSLTNIPEDIFSGCSAVTSFYSCFYKCSSLINIPENIFSGCSAVTSFYRCFSNCSSLTNIPEGMFSGCSAVTSFNFCFSDCSSLTNIPEGMFSGCSAVTSFSYCFRNCYSLNTVPVNLFDDSLLVTNFENTFYGCSSVEGESPYTDIEVDGENVRVHLYEREDYAVAMRYAIPTSYEGCFTGSSFSDIDSIPSNWKK